MSSQKSQVRTYRIDLFNKMDGGACGEGAKALIVCTGAGGESLAIAFVPPSTRPEPPICGADGTSGSMTEPMEYMGHYMDLLRNEKPVYAQLWPNHPEHNGLSTSAERIGEGEAG